MTQPEQEQTEMNECEATTVAKLADLENQVYNLRIKVDSLATTINNLAVRLQRHTRTGHKPKRY